MERLTERDTTYCDFCDGKEKCGEDGQSECYVWKLYEQLKKYEDTGVTPEDTQDFILLLNENDDEDSNTGTLEALLEWAKYKRREEKGCNFCNTEYTIMSGSRMTADGIHKGCTAKFCTNCGQRLRRDDEK